MPPTLRLVVLAQASGSATRLNKAASQAWYGIVVVVRLEVGRPPLLLVLAHVLDLTRASPIVAARCRSALALALALPEGGRVVIREEVERRGE
jgi:hypothetical protein